jgi:hypothetical protein
MNAIEVGGYDVRRTFRKRVLRNFGGEVGENPTLQALRDYFRFAGRPERLNQRRICRKTYYCHQRWNNLD